MFHVSFYQVLDVTYTLGIQGYKGNTPKYLQINDVYYLNNTTSEPTYSIFYELNIEKVISVSHDISMIWIHISPRFL